MPNNNTPSTFSPALTKSLLQEFDALRNAIISLNCTEACMDNSTDLLAVVRLLSGITRKEWAELAEKYNLGHWLALDMKKPATQNLTELYDQMRELAFQKDHDPLTGLPNRRLFMRNFQVELERQERQQTGLSMVSIDLDHFKRINDTWGHGAGDLVLKRLADTLAHSKRVYDTTARLGGEEFALLLPGAPQTRAKAIVQRILNNFRSTPFVLQDGSKFFVTFSAGIASIRGDVKQSIEQIMDVADKALYEAKHSGRNRIVATDILIEGEIKKSMVHSDEKHFLFFGKHK